MSKLFVDGQWTEINQLNDAALIRWFLNYWENEFSKSLMTHEKKSIRKIIKQLQEQLNEISKNS